MENQNKSEQDNNTIQEFYLFKYREKFIREPVREILEKILLNLPIVNNQKDYVCWSSDGKIPFTKINEEKLESFLLNLFETFNISHLNSIDRLEVLNIKTKVEKINSNDESIKKLIVNLIDQSFFDKNASFKDHKTNMIPDGITMITINDFLKAQDSSYELKYDILMI